MFFDDQNNETHGGPRPAEHHSEAQSPLLLHEIQSPEEAFGVPPSTKRPQQLVVVALLVGGAVACIFAMRQFGLGALPAFGGPELEYQAAQTTTASQAKQVLADLERSRKAVQVSAEHIKHDPFELAAGVPEQTAAPRIDTAADAARRAEEARLARQKVLRDALGKLQLEGVMLGTVPVARINDELLKIGMVVGEHFTVARIEGRSVMLAADGQEFELTLDVENSPGATRRK